MSLHHGRSPPRLGAPLGEEGDLDLFVLAVRGKGEVVKEGERLPQAGREVCRAGPGRERVEKGLQGLLVRRDRGAVDGTREDLTDELHDERVLVRALICPSLPPLARSRASGPLYSIAHAHPPRTVFGARGAEPPAGTGCRAGLRRRPRGAVRRALVYEATRPHGLLGDCGAAGPVPAPAATYCERSARFTAATTSAAYG